MTRAQKVTKVTTLFRDFFKVIAPTNDGEEIDLRHSPARIGKMYVNELLSGYNDAALRSLQRKFTTFPRKPKHELVIIRGAPFTSLCSHHMMPFFGHATLGYVPGDRVIGLSKFPRVVQHFSRRFQTQENLTSEIADFIQTHAEPQCMIVALSAHHLCCSARGIEKEGVEMLTSALRPTPEEFPDSLKREFFDMLKVQL